MPAATKCLFISSNFPPPLFGGSEVYYYYLLSQCAAEDVIVVTRPKEHSIEVDNNLSYRVLRNRWMPSCVESSLVVKLRWLFMMFPLLVVWIWRNRISVIHIGTYLPDIIAGWLVARLMGRSIMVTILGEELTAKVIDYGYFGRLTRRFHRSLGLWMLRRCDCVKTISTFTRQALLDRGVPADRIVIITPGVDTEKTSCDKKIDPEIASRLTGRRIVLTVGRFSRRKGQDMVLRAINSLLGQFPNLIYIIAGTGDRDEREYYETIIHELGLHDHALILEGLDSPAIAWLYDACEIFIMANRTLPSGDTEGYGIVFLEAGAWGKPVIGGRAGGAPDAVDDGITGLLVDGTSIDDIANAVRRLLSDKELAQRLGEAGRSKVSRNTWGEKSAEYIRLLDKLVKKSAIPIINIERHSS